MHPYFQIFFYKIFIVTAAIVLCREEATIKISSYIIAVHVIYFQVIMNPHLESVPLNQPLCVRVGVWWPKGMCSLAILYYCKQTNSMQMSLQFIGSQVAYETEL